MIKRPTTWITKEAYQGEMLPEWTFTLTDENDVEISTYDAKMVFKGSGSSFALYPGEGIVKEGAKCTVDFKIPDDQKHGVYTIELKVVLSNGNPYKMNAGQFTIQKTNTND